MSRLSCIGVLAHPKRPPTFALAQQIAHTLAQQGLQTWYATDWDEHSVNERVQEAEMVIAIGGDGAMLKAARVCARFAVPVLGINMGRLGFLTEIPRPDVWMNHLNPILAGNYWVETRMMITVSVFRHDQRLTTGNALNDVVISSDKVGRMVQLELYIDGDWATTYSADALIVATPTGSTAYALASGGPILPPDLRNILIVPTAPHLSMDRPIVVSEGAQVRVRPTRENRYPILVNVDGMELVTVAIGDTIQIQTCDYNALFVRLRPRNYFYRSLLDRLEPRFNRMPDNPQSLEEDEPHE